MFDFFKLKSPIGRSYNTDPDDVRKTKKVLNTFGYYDEPAHGITEYPDGAMISGIESFQKDNGLKKDGVMKPGGETERTIGSMISGQLQKTERSKAAATQPTTFSSALGLAPKKPKEPMPIQMGYKLGEALKLSAPVGLNQKNEPSDVNRIKKAMSWTGLYPSHEAEQQDGQMNQNLMRSIGMFQSANGLKQDFWMKPDGETAKNLDTNLQNKFAALVKMADASGGDGGGGDDGGDKPGDPPSEGDSPPDDGGEKPEKPDEPKDPEEPPKEDEDPCKDLEELMNEARDAQDELQDEYLKL
ncbi:peptidoglycan-binding domain-containing protein, partial [Magnetovibrio blakemorei]|uniref:peptidoglycan-binding domain-containing protein n=1 Tax=Magnetovibrio blakemorei TaxID=28181 RepID=UPI0014818583